MTIEYGIIPLGPRYLLASRLAPNEPTLRPVASWRAQRIVRAGEMSAPLRRAFGQLGWVVSELDDTRLVALANRLLESGAVRLLHRPEPPIGTLMPFGTEESEDFTPATEETHWIQIQVCDQDGNPLPSVAFELKLPDDHVMRGVTNQYGVVYASGLPAGQCTLSLTEIEASAWKN